MKHESHTRTVQVLRSEGEAHEEDVVAVEEPLEIRLGMTRRGMRGQKSISITMRTPGSDAELAVGFLHGEGLIRHPREVTEVRHCGDPDEGRENRNVIRVELADDVEVDLSRLQRNFYTTSSCGVCGKSSLEALELTGYRPIDDDVRVHADLAASLPGRLREQQRVFDLTGGLHAAATFGPDGAFGRVREDVGRHNALDKLVGASFLAGELPLGGQLLLLSGRASFELLQKALVARLPVVCAVGAPSSLAVDLAERFGITLLGFVRGGRFNVYSHPERIV